MVFTLMFDLQTIHTVLRRWLSRLGGLNLNSPMAKVAYVAGVTMFCTFLGCWVVLAHQDTPRDLHRSSKPVPTDEQFAKQAAQGGLSEIKLAQLAQEKSASEDVKRLAQRLVQDHAKANDELKKAAKKESIALPDTLDAKDQARFDSLSKLYGDGFDKAYARDTVKGHEQDIAEFNAEAKNGQKEAIQLFAVETLPMLNDHLNAAREMRKSLVHPPSTAAKTPAAKSRPAARSKSK